MVNYGRSKRLACEVSHVAPYRIRNIRCDMNEVGTNNEWNALQMREAYLRERCAEEVELYMHLTGCEGPNLKSDYMLRIGQFEYKVFQLRMDAARWQRRFTLRQRALNRGETPDLMSIEKELDAEFADYLEKIKEHLRTVQDAGRHASMKKLSEEETNEIRVNYLKAVKRLHPDINPNLPETAIELWNKIQAAYKDRDWKELAFLTGIVDEVLHGVDTSLVCTGSMDELVKRTTRLRQRYDALLEKRRETESKEPFVWRELLHDDGEVARRRAELDRQIQSLNAAIDEYEDRWNDKRTWR